ncbi:MAG TPA: polysaccharide deacetylase family protein [Burkholderiaceae bacterium]|nr:polysaccharide deacetylase family protein [Burkholderiaceae bacterium]
MNDKSLIAATFPALFFGVFLGLSGCAGPSLQDRVDPGSSTTNHAPIRFLLTFDDGPAASGLPSPTQSILDDLANNPLQPGIKAIFFLQTRASDAGGSPLGKQLMQREYDDGHLLAFHTATAGHTNHRYLEPALFEQSLNDGIADIRHITGTAPLLVRPPFWSYDQRTFSVYQTHGLHILLTDLSANDGKTWGINFSLRRRSSMLHQLGDVKGRIEHGDLPVIDGCIPVVVTFHDINSYTARHMQEYLQILLDSAGELGLPTTAKPFYDQRGDLEHAAIGRTITDPALKVHLPGLWNWIWN